MISKCRCAITGVDRELLLRDNDSRDIVTRFSLAPRWFSSLNDVKEVISTVREFYSVHESDVGFSSTRLEEYLTIKVKNELHFLESKLHQQTMKAESAIQMENENAIVCCG